MTDFSGLLKYYRDGTVLYRHPVVESQAWYAPARKYRPILTENHKSAQPINHHKPEDYCPFCEARTWETTPEKSRLKHENDEWRLYDQLLPDSIFKTPADFRRIANLYEIVSVDYWKENYGYALSPKNKHFKEQYLSSDKGRQHIADLVREKFKKVNLNKAELERLISDPSLDVADAFFGGSHELIISKRHFIDQAENDAQLCSTGLLSPEEVDQFNRLTIFSVNDIYKNNPFVTYVCVYTNWGGHGGASFEHLHRQIIGLDRWGHYLKKSANLAQNNPDFFRDYFTHLGEAQNLVICENDHAIAVADSGHPFPGMSVVLKKKKRPYEATSEERRGMSDLLHALHAAMGPGLACNEEWYYAPPDYPVDIPWHITIKWRIARHAGIEGATGLYIHPVSPEDIRDQITERLFTLRTEHKVAPFQIGEDCKLDWDE